MDLSCCICAVSGYVLCHPYVLHQRLKLGKVATYLTTLSAVELFSEFWCDFIDCLFTCGLLERVHRDAHGDDDTHQDPPWGRARKGERSRPIRRYSSEYWSSLRRGGSVGGSLCDSCISQFSLEKQSISIYCLLSIIPLFFCPFFSYPPDGM